MIHFFLLRSGSLHLCQPIAAPPVRNVAHPAKNQKKIQSKAAAAAVAAAAAGTQREAADRL